MFSQALIDLLKIGLIKLCSLERIKNIYYKKIKNDL